MKRFVARVYATIVLDAADKGDANNRVDMKLDYVQGLAYRVLEIEEVDMTRRPQVSEGRG